MTNKGILFEVQYLFNPVSDDCEMVSTLSNGLVKNNVTIIGVAVTHFLSETVEKVVTYNRKKFYNKKQKLIFRTNID